VTIEELRMLVAEGESEHLEFKCSTGSLSDGIKSVCAMLNGALPGIVLFGVNDRGDVVGQEVSTRTREDVANDLRKIEPPAFPTVESVSLENGREVIALRVPGGTGLYVYDGRPYYRSGPTTSVMPRDLYAQQLMEKMRAPDRWENWPTEGFTIQDLDAREIVRTIEEAIRRQRMDDPGTRDPEELLLGLG
jgi:ATP-dependent DNA helicase RecG